MSEHTPGPWRLAENSNIGNMIEAHCGEWEFGERWRAVATFQSALGGNPTYIEERENRDANGRLIAAAPELLEALEHLLSAYKLLVLDAEGCSNVYDAEQAIAKARGNEGGE